MNKWISAVLICFISGCTTTIDEYKEQLPKLDLAQFFDGKLVAHGIVQDRNQLVTRRFKVNLTGTWNNNQGQLDEVFYFNDGEQQTRCWLITKSNDSYTGQAGDVEGKATGRVVGNTLNWQYTLNINIDGEEWPIKLDDWLYLIDQDTLINKTDMSYLGLHVGELTLAIRKADHNETTKAC